MKKILFVTYSLAMGGAEKSLVSLLQSMNPKRFTVDLLLMKRDGPLMELVPDWVRVIDTPEDLREYALDSKKAGGNKLSFGKLLRKFAYTLIIRLKAKKEGLLKTEAKWLVWGRKLKPLPGYYDAAVSFMEGGSNYYVIEKTDAGRKFIWMHSYFEKLGLHPAFQKSFFERADGIGTISDMCAENIVKYFPDTKDKVHVLENITSAGTVRLQSRMEPDDARFNADKGFKILSVGRLHPAKGYDMAIDAARLLKTRGVAFTWYMIGTGEMEAELKRQAKEREVEDCFIFLGLKTNPYAYMARADLLAQTSRYEGRSIVVDEAKILLMPILTTRYPSVGDTLTHGENGWIVEMNPEAIAGGIRELIDHPETREALKDYLKAHPFSNEREVLRYESLFDGDEIKG